MTDDDTLAQSRLHISKHSFARESTCVQSLLEQTATFTALEDRIYARAGTLIEQMRADQNDASVEAFLQTYGLDSQEGVAIMCLAEALLRIPDRATADALIKDTFNQANWQHHIGQSESLMVNASSWGLMLTGAVVSLQGENPLGVVGRAIGRLGEPVIRESLKTAMRIIGKQFVLGEDITDALDEANNYHQRNYRVSFDMLGEGARNDAQAQAYLHAYLEAFEAIAVAAKTLPDDTYNMSVKLSALHPRFQLTKRKQLQKELLPRLVAVVEKARSQGIHITIDAEEASRLDITLELFTELLHHPCADGFDGIGYVVQAYQKRAALVVDYLAELAKRTGRTIPVRLVKGAYWDSEIKWAQMAGLEGYPVFTQKAYTDVNYLVCAEKLLQHATHFYPQFATHNARTAASIIELAEHLAVPSDGFEFQRLHGMGEELHDQLTSDYRCRVYAPVGRHRDLLAYLIRRLMENGANTSFLNQLMDKNTPVDALLTDPIVSAKQAEGKPNDAIPVPKRLYVGRWRNSMGLDAEYHQQHEALSAELAAFSEIHWRAGPIVKQSNISHLEKQTIVEPAATHITVGEAIQADEALVDTAMHHAKEAFETWSVTPVKERCEILKRAADLIETHRTELMALCMREAGKTWDDAIAEIREAADFCRFYAWQARKLLTPNIRPGPTGESNVLSLHARGVMGCISPWNFPLAIFTGQVAAALVCGNSVLAKPAGQTPLIAHKAVQLLLEAGLPEGVLQLLPGGGSTVGAAMVKHADIAGIVFTGSTATAKHIQRSMAEKDGPIVPLIAETGGINCMVIDSSALLEQACDDVMISAFGSAGQRCSALRLLYVQEDVADDFITLLAGAMQELTIARPWSLDADIGPVIDPQAKQSLIAHIDDMHQRARFIAQAPLDDSLAKQGHFVAPHAFELPDDTMLTEEFFGPILHVVRFKGSELSELPMRMNRLGYGLTFGIHSRIKDHVAFFNRHMRVGNSYANRSMTGAVVGVQPFGGEGLSGTGPKAGGPHYLTSFLTERHTCINTAAIGGDLGLLSKV